MFSRFFRTQQANPTTPLYLRNTASGEREVFEAHNPNKVTLYTCGPTVYDHPTIGNFRSYIFADTLKRVLQYNGYTVKHTMNLTDFGHLTSDADTGEDKMMLALSRAGMEPTLENMRKVAEPFIEVFKTDMEALGNIPPDAYTRASDYVREQIALIRTLVEKGYTYETSDGIYFDISRFPRYGSLGHIDLAALKEGARVEANPEKKHPADFAIWKKGELGWESPWGTGFPGWHIECTAMAFATLGKQIDLHTGGEDLAYTHHNGEIAQAEAATGRHPYVRYWLHNAFITIDGKRIGKSMGNAITLRQLKDRGFSPRTYRYWLQSAHYRSPVNFTFEALEAARAAHFRLKRFVLEEWKESDGSVVEEYRTRFHEAVNDDLDTPKALAILWELTKDSSVAPKDKAATVRHFDTVLALGLTETAGTEERTLGVIATDDLPEEIQTLLTKREQARAQKDWEQADTLREEINLKGYLVEDGPKGPRVTKG
jgi:cysteinyl-tRNA synthetase